MKTDTETNCALRNARAHIASWADAYAKYQALNSGVSEVEIDGETFNDPTDIAERLCEGALSVEVRGDWHTTGREPSNSEFRILVSTGGPAFQITGDLDMYGNPTSARAEHQDWDTPWAKVELDNTEQAAVAWFATLFYYVE